MEFHDINSMLKIRKAVLNEKTKQLYIYTKFGIYIINDYTAQILHDLKSCKKLKVIK